MGEPLNMVTGSQNQNVAKNQDEHQLLSNSEDLERLPSLERIEVGANRTTISAFGVFANSTSMLERSKYYSKGRILRG